MKLINLKITTPERVVLEERVSQLSVMTGAGEITILPDHIPLITVLSPGIARAIKEDGQEITMAISGGFLELSNNYLTILADTAERAEEIDLERAEQARRKAEELKQEARRNMDEEQFAVVASQLEKNLARIRAAKRFRMRTKELPNFEDK